VSGPLMGAYVIIYVHTIPFRFGSFHSGTYPRQCLDGGENIPLDERTRAHTRLLDEHFVVLIKSFQNCT
jgi:hypothetical protein